MRTATDDRHENRDALLALADKAAHRLEQRGEALAVSLVEERGESVECVCRERLELVGGHDVSSIRTRLERATRTLLTRR